MSYDIRDNTVLWSGKALTGVTADVFEVLEDDRFARAGDTLLMRGKPVRADASSFTLLSKTYAKDSTCVFQIMEVKLKPLPKANAATFEAVGGRFGRDQNSAWFEAKPMKSADPGALRALDQRYATDGVSLFFEQKAFKLPKDLEFDWASARMRVQEGVYTKHDFIIWGETGTYFVEAFNRPGAWMRIETDAPENLRFMRTSDDFWESSVWVTDGQRVFWRGRHLPGSHPDAIDLLSDTVAVASGEVLVGDAPAPEINAASLTHLEGPLYADATALWTLRSGWTLGGELRIVKDRLAERRPLASAPIAAIEAFFKAAIADLLAMLDVMEGAEGAQRLNPAQSVEADPAILSRLSMTRSGKTIIVTLDTVEASGHAADWYRISCGLWAQSQDRPVQLFHYPSHSVTGTYLQNRVFERHRDKALLAAQAFRDLGHEEAAQYLAGQALIEIFGRGKYILEEQNKDVLAQVDPDLLQNARWPLFQRRCHKTTYLAGARAAIELEGLSDPDFQTRWGAIAFMHYMIVSTGQPKHFLSDVVPPIVAMVDAEEVGFIRDLALAALDAACDRFNAERDGLRAQCRPFIKRLIAEQVNTEQNRARLVGSG